MVESGGIQVGVHRFSGCLQPFSVQHRMRKPLPCLYSAYGGESLTSLACKQSEFTASDVSIVAVERRSRDIVLYMPFSDITSSDSPNLMRINLSFLSSGRHTDHCFSQTTQKADSLLTRRTADSHDFIHCSIVAPYRISVALWYSCAAYRYCLYHNLSQQAESRPKILPAPAHNAFL